jgi:hypothetical protein
MDKSTKIQIRISVEALAAFDAEAAAEGMTRTAFLINSAWQRVHSARPISNAADQRAIKQRRDSADREIAHTTPAMLHAQQIADSLVAANLNDVTTTDSPMAHAASDNRYQRPKHAPNCHCYACKPQND